MENETSMTLTTGGYVPDPITGNCIITYPYEWPYTPQPYVQTITVTPPPYCCDDNVHVFGCDKTLVCKCGKTRRAEAVKPPKCPHCGKRHK